MIERLGWDSEFFGIEVGKIVNESFSHTADTKAFDLLYVFNGNPADTGIPNFRKCFEGTYQEYTKRDLVKKSKISPHIHAACTLDFNIDELYTLAFSSGTASRFNKDLNITPDTFKQLYKTWIDNSLQKTIADDVLLYVEATQIEGFISYKNHSNYTTIGLFAVHEGRQGQGIGKKLLRAVENKLAAMNIQELRIPTQMENKAACAFYEKMGYTLRNAYLLQHFWKL